MSERKSWASSLAAKQSHAIFQCLTQKRQMAVERWAKRNSRVKARNLNDRIQLERDDH